MTDTKKPLVIRLPIHDAEQKHISAVWVAPEQKNYSCPSEEHILDVSMEDMERFLRDYAYTYGYYFDKKKAKKRAKQFEADDIQLFHRGDLVRYKKGAPDHEIYIVLSSYYDEYGGDRCDKHLYTLRHCWELQESSWHSESELELLNNSL